MSHSNRIKHPTANTKPVKHSRNVIIFNKMLTWFLKMVLEKWLFKNDKLALKAIILSIPDCMNTIEKKIEIKIRGKESEKIIIVNSCWSELLKIIHKIIHFFYLKK